MSGSASDWLNAQNTGNVLSSIANPKTINLLGMYGDVARTASAIWQNRQAQANQAQGEAAVNAIDPSTGQMNQQQYGAAMHAAGPNAALGAQDSMQKAQTLSSNQLGFNDQQQTSIGRGIGSMLTQPNEAQTPAAYRAQLQYLRTVGAIDDNHLASASAQLDALGPNPSPQDMRTFGTRLLIGGLAGPDIAKLSLPGSGTQTGPNGRTIGFTQQPALLGGGVNSTAQPGAPQGMEQSDINTIVNVPYPKLLPNGQPNPQYGGTFPMRKGDILPLISRPGGGAPGGGGNLPPSLRNPANAANAPANAAPAAPANPPAYAPANPGASGGGIGAVLNPQGANAVATTPPAATVVPGPGGVPTVNVTPHPAVAAPPPVTPPAAVVAPPAPVVPPPAALPPNAPHASLQGGVPVASTNALAPNVGSAAPPNPLVPGDVNAIMAGMARGRAAASVVGSQTAQAGAPNYTGIPGSTGVPFGSAPSAADIEMQRQQVTQAAEGFKAISDQAVQSRGRSAILGNMLGDTQAFTTGPLASRIQAVRAIANRFGLPVSTEGLSAAESFNKLAAQLANAQGAGSDARLGVNQAANPHAELSPQGIDLMIRQLQGNEDYLQARAKLAASYPDRGNVQKFESEIGTQVDPRAFQYNRMTPEQRTTYDKGLSDQDRAAVKASFNWLYHQRLVGN